MLTCARDAVRGGGYARRPRQAGARAARRPRRVARQGGRAPRLARRTARLYTVARTAAMHSTYGGLLILIHP